MRRKNSLHRKAIASFLILVMTITALIGVSFAIYTSQVFQRSVVRNRNTGIVRFSSDKLISVAIDSNATEIYYPVVEGQTTMSFRICNYDQTRSTLVNETDIGYTISFSFADKDDSFNYSVTCNDKSIGSSENTHRILRGGVASVDNYTVSFTENDYRKLKMTVTVIPDDLSITQNNILKASLIPISYGTTQQFHVNLEFPDKLRKKEGDSPMNPAELDAYNVLITASGGEGDVYISWNPEMVEIDKYFLVDHKLTPVESDGNNKIVLHMNSATKDASYLIPFYNSGSSSNGFADWSTLLTYINVGIVESE